MAIVVAVVKSRMCRMRRRSRKWQCQALEWDEICLEKDNVESNMVGMLGIMGLVVGREREGLTILEVC